MIPSSQQAIQKCLKKICNCHQIPIKSLNYVKKAQISYVQRLDNLKALDESTARHLTSASQQEMNEMTVKKHKGVDLPLVRSNSIASSHSCRDFSTFATFKSDPRAIEGDFGDEEKPSERFLRIQSKFCRVCGSGMKILKPSGDKEWRHVCSSCGFVDYFNPKMVVGCIVEHEGKILLCRRAIEPSYGLWTVPAGYMELNESTAEGAARETFEESTARVQHVSPYAHWDIPAIGQSYILFRARLAHPFTHAPGVESLETRLFSPEEIPFPLLAFNTVTESLRLYIDDMESGRFRMHYGVIRKVPVGGGGPLNPEPKEVGKGGIEADSAPRCSNSSSSSSSSNNNSGCDSNRNSSNKDDQRSHHHHTGKQDGASMGKGQSNAGDWGGMEEGSSEGMDAQNGISRIEKGADAGKKRDGKGQLPGGLAEELFGRYEVQERQSFYVVLDEK
uniref:Nudix hydrolase domain-containing protein n=1 Tax=Polytomella parva TaxID=51329 RepID=A0A7S0YTF8_9CHLO|mmetsp:Transcript_8396/g.16127  ORF Transcript_8396/g.16127 Transcript_8396/m.16127 type:complete len:447 (+) Transcript_8396:214-1554(+)|eukprot:CAMPEP_0175041468 /NCGR_PEP_ID=MMETSP0052_2-20121109/1931_1 /TAXON_ID=51329 ORGANISM="Polytomella parva, Strain SAG 63-3" /NCGR_SAMPLE_ID=MMETSP0052_2 /ASSEMBLY_ACC=CAM_ASM_000194 /LENGTH=446 /DNA_ID=CAMNT_0016303985 /DNA_START=127 /DNA_END=1467 /DNA_ORIENTATION=+